MDNRTSNMSDDEQYDQNSNQTPNTSASNSAGQQSGYSSPYNPYLTGRQITYQSGLYQPPYQQPAQQSNQQSYQYSAQQSYQQGSYQAPQSGQAAYRPAGTYYAQPAYAANQNGSGRRAISYDAHTQKESGHRSSVGTVPKVIIGALIGLIVGFLISFILMNVFVTAPIPVSATLAEDKLDTVVGSYRYDGITYQITAREAILGSTTLESRLNDDGTYDTPTADMIVAYARNEILAKLVAENGITVTTEEVTSYALQATGSSNWTTIAQYLGMDEDQAREVMAEAAAVGKLREMITGDSAAPVAPTYPADGQTEVGTPEYANYIISLLGPYWDSSTGTWADTDNEYYEVLQDQVFAPGSASYEAAELAYAIAYQDYLNSSSGGITWLDYVNSYLDNASIAVATLRA